MKMKKVIDGILYNTETATKIAKKSNGLSTSDFYFIREVIYQTRKERYFLFCEGGAATQYADKSDGCLNSGETIIPLSEDDAYEMLQDWDEVDLIESLFPDRIEEA